MRLLLELKFQFAFQSHHLQHLHRGLTNATMLLLSHNLVASDIPNVYKHVWIICGMIMTRKNRSTG